MSKLIDLLDLLRKGSAVTDPKLWKDRAALTLALTGLIVVVVKVAKGFGYDLQINETDAGYLAAGFAVLVGLFSTYATSDKVGILPAKVQPDSIPDDARPAEPERTAVDQHQHDYPRDTGGGG
jgi:hypothetical protein